MVRLASPPFHFPTSLTRSSLVDSGVPLNANTEDGIFGMVDQQLKKQIQGEPMEVARCQEVKPGPAVIRTAVSGEVKDYTV